MGSFGSRLIELIKKSEYSQKEIASMVGVTESAISKYIKDEREPKYEILANLATALDTTCDYLLNGTDPSEDIDYLKRLVQRSTHRMTKEEKEAFFRDLNE